MSPSNFAHPSFKFQRIQPQTSHHPKNHSRPINEAFRQKNPIKHFDEHLARVLISRTFRSAMAVAAVARCTALILPFPFYYALWNHPQTWVDLCGRGVDPCHRMAQVSHVLKVIQILALLSVATLSWPPWYCLLLFAAGQYLNFKVYQLLGEPGTYYGVRFGKTIPWVTEFPFGYIKDPQYTGSILSLLALLCWVPMKYVMVWIIGYIFMVLVEFKEDPATRAKPVS